MAENNKNEHMALIAIVAIVAIVGLFLMFFNTGSKTTTSTQEDLAGQAIARQQLISGGEVYKQQCRAACMPNCNPGCLAAWEVLDAINSAKESGSTRLIIGGTAYNEMPQCDEPCPTCDIWCVIESLENQDNSGNGVSVYIGDDQIGKWDWDEDGKLIWVPDEE